MPQKSWKKVRSRGTPVLGFLKSLNARIELLQRPGVAVAVASLVAYS